MAKVRFHPLLEYIRGTIKGMAIWAEKAWGPR